MASRLFGNGVGVDDEASDHKRAFVPKNAWEFLWGVTKTFGFPALMCAALGWYVWWLQGAHADTARAAHEDFKTALSEQTAAMREGTVEQRKMTEAMIELKVRLESHMREEERRRR